MMVPDIPSFRTAGLGHWLARQISEPGHLHLFFQSFCEELKRRGLPVWRANLGVEILHPETSGRIFTWTDGVITRRDNDRASALGAEYLNSPVRIVDETDRPFRRRLDRPSPDLPLLDELRAGGATDYAIFPLPFLDKSRSAFISFATQAAAGFGETDLAEIEMAAALFSPYAERGVLRRLAVDLLETYVGRRSGERIFGGHIERGKIETIGAAISMADLRDFTRLADTQPQETVIAILNAWFECLAAATEAHGGEILKFMGDGLLAIFPVEGAPGEACERAFRAACSAQTTMAAVNLYRAAKGEVELACGFGLHLGDVGYGNVGGRRRLDFTVIGPAVNLAARLEGLTRELGVPLLMSEAFAGALSQEMLSLGHHAIRGLDRTQQVFVPPS
jgi:adenylate cyclase